MSFPLSDRVLGPEYLAALDSLDVVDLRLMRSECESVEASVSFARRVLQGRLDIVGNELSQRRAGAHSDGDLHDLINRLPQILAGEGTARSSGTGPAWRAVDVAPDHVVVDELISAIDAVAPVGVMSTLARLADADVESVAGQLQALEREFSDTRHQLHERIDAVKGELTSRYGRGEVTVEGLLG